MELLNPSYEETKINQRPADRLLELRAEKQLVLFRMVKKILRHFLNIYPKF